MVLDIGSPTSSTYNYHDGLFVHSFKTLRFGWSIRRDKPFLVLVLSELTDASLNLARFFFFSVSIVPLYERNDRPRFISTGGGGKL